MTRKSLSDTIFDWTLNAIGWGLNLVLFVLIWLVAFLFFAIFLSIVFPSTIWLAFVIATVVAGFSVWFLNKFMSDTIESTVQVFGNQDASRALTQQKNAADVLYETEVQEDEKREGESDVAFRLRQIAKLRDQGLISEDEFKTKREDILRNL